MLSGLWRGGQLVALGDGADLGLGDVAHGEEDVVELLLPEREEEVALVLGGIDGAAQDVAAILLLDAGVVAGGEPGARGRARA